jgi:hypothetical protein
MAQVPQFGTKKAKADREKCMGGQRSCFPIATISHFDSSKTRHHDVCVRTTVTLEPDVARLLNDQAHRTRKSFKETLNAAVRIGLGHVSEPGASSSFTIEARPMQIKVGMDAGRFNSMLDELDADDFAAKARAGGHEKARL